MPTKQTSQILLGAACWTQFLGIIGYCYDLFLNWKRCTFPQLEKYKGRLLCRNMNDFSLGHSVPAQESIFK